MTYIGHVVGGEWVKMALTGGEKGKFYDALQSRKPKIRSLLVLISNKQTSSAKLNTRAQRRTVSTKDRLKII
jgi:hypothetical protein